MLKTKINHRVSAMAIMLSALLFLGAGCQNQGQVSISTEKTAVQAPFEPLKLVYEVKNFGPVGSSGKLDVTFWLENKEQCAGREAYTGLMKIESNLQSADSFFSQWLKITVFADNGEIAVSRPEGEDKLAFDDMKSEYDQFNIALTLNSIFAYAGKNFNSSEVWTSAVPIILKNVDSGISLTDYSFIRQEEQTTGILPCQKFKIAVKGTSMDGAVNACVAKEINNIKLPFVVSMVFGDPNQKGPSWDLVSYSKEKSGVSFVPQCLEPVKCVYPKEPDQAARTVCIAGGGQFEQQRTEKGCIEEYKCLTQEEIVRANMARMQRPGCAINQKILNKIIGCRKNNQPNFDVTAQSNDGCIANVTCRP